MDNPQNDEQQFCEAYEIGRYKKAVADRDKKITALETDLKNAISGIQEMNVLVDAILAAVATIYGEQVTDSEGDGTPLGWRLEIPYFDAEKIRDKYEVKTRMDAIKTSYIVGVVERNSGCENSSPVV